jgi:RNA polymerase sigma-70 factor, ECF subfamily
MDDETALVIRLSRGDETALQNLYERLSRQVFSLALQMLNNHQDAEEVLQDTFVKLATHNSFHPSYGSARAYIYTIARNECLMRLRAKGSRPQLSELDSYERVLEAQSKDQDTALTLKDALSKLESLDAKLLTGSFYWGYTHDELSQQTGLPLGTVKSRVRRALLKLRDLLTDADVFSQKRGDG